MFGGLERKGQKLWICKKIDEVAEKSKISTTTIKGNTTMSAVITS
jgi:hypothetical protein